MRKAARLASVTLQEKRPIRIGAGPTNHVRTPGQKRRTCTDGKCAHKTSFDTLSLMQLYYNKASGFVW
jgi:hypothetical protein